MPSKKNVTTNNKEFINCNFKEFNTYNSKEINAALSVITSGKLSSFIGNQSQGLKGGEYVEKFEKKLQAFFKVKYAITVNSWTSGLICAIGAIGVEPGDEVIVPTWTMSACAAAVLHWNAIPVFADIEEDTFCISKKSIEKNISKKTKAIIVVDIFGHPANYQEIKKIAKKYNLKIICDAAQSPGSKYFGKYSGTVGDIGGFSFNYHKHIHTGEGGAIVTNNKIYATKMKLIRNHAEAVVLNNSKKKDLVNMLGHNFRMGEIEAAIGIQQLAKLSKIIKKRQYIAKLLINKLSKLKYIRLPIIKKNCTHVFYVFPIVLDNKIIKKRDLIISLLNKYGLKKIGKGYQNLHLQPIYQKKICYGKKSFPWSLSKRKINYKKGICPNAEKLHSHSFLSFGISFYDLNRQDVYNISKIFKKTWSNIGLL
jgi:dTDP-4-amino-4,6-dideoxygalactose transaminase